MNGFALVLVGLGLVLLIVGVSGKELDLIAGLKGKPVTLQSGKASTLS